MSEEFAFARKASGLVRGLSASDVFAMALMFIQPIYAIWISVMVGAGLFPGGNLLIALAVSLVMCGVFGPLMWGILSGTMPRSGGEYIFNSRILSAPIAQAASVANAIAGIYWGFLAATWIAKPSLQMLCDFMGWESAANWFGTNKYSAILLGIVGIILAFLVVAFGLRVYKLIQKPLLVIGIGGPLVLMFCLVLTSRASFISSWNELAVKYGSLDYNSFTGAVGNFAGGSLPTTWNWHDTIGMMSAMSLLFIYTYAIAYVGGEVKRPQKSMLLSGWLAIGVTVLIAGLTFFGLYRALGFTFLNATALNSLVGGVPGYTFPFQSSYMTVAWIAGHHNAVIGWIAALTFLLTSFWILVIQFVVAGRSWFAWGMDRMGPKWFTSVNARHATPMWNYVGWLVLNIVGLVVFEVWLTSQFSGLIASGMQLISVFLITAISALVLPYRKKTHDIWDSSPYRSWKIAGVPIITIAGAVYIIYIGILLYFAFLDRNTRDVNGKNAIFMFAAWAIGGLWYLFWRRRSKAVGIDVAVTYGQLPPE